ncbi:MAG: hypothetical protein AVDCRST_MAG93-787 [uncultured Chloroflexia bacterium]|uniref:Uncharacterized protein n=1 Tax=uncultured Chloroflexia bacterium TaxID=1672391 RepID=A0A6J4HPT7_9CHLR|nr:MAG: hypothetical protein AVDCRST_MAG93-787 [uncultured Chloroflexia bacterium]
MSMQTSPQSSKPPLGGISRGWRPRLLRFYVPLTLVSILTLVLFMTLPSFDASAYPTLDMHSSGPLPQVRSERERMDMDDMEMDHDEDRAEPMEGEDHGSDRAEPTDGGDHGEDHGRDRAKPSEGHS